MEFVAVLWGTVNLWQSHPEDDQAYQGEEPLIGILQECVLVVLEVPLLPILTILRLRSMDARRADLI